MSKTVRLTEAQRQLVLNALTRESSRDRNYRDDLEEMGVCPDVAEAISKRIDERESIEDAFRVADVVELSAGEGF